MKMQETKVYTECFYYTDVGRESVLPKEIIRQLTFKKLDQETEFSPLG